MPLSEYWIGSMTTVISTLCSPCETHLHCQNQYNLRDYAQIIQGTTHIQIQPPKNSYLSSRHMSAGRNGFSRAIRCKRQHLTCPAQCNKYSPCWHQTPDQSSILPDIPNSKSNHATLILHPPPHRHPPPRNNPTPRPIRHRPPLHDNPRIPNHLHPPTSSIPNINEPTLQNALHNRQRRKPNAHNLPTLNPTNLIPNLPRRGTRNPRPSPHPRPIAENHAAGE